VKDTCKESRRQMVRYGIAIGVWVPSSGLTQRSPFWGRVVYSPCLVEPAGDDANQYGERPLLRLGIVQHADLGSKTFHGFCRADCFDFLIFKITCALHALQPSQPTDVICEQSWRGCLIAPFNLQGVIGAFD